VFGVKSIKLRGKLGSEGHANDYFFQVPTLDGEDLWNLLKEFEGVVVSLTVKPLLGICPECGSRMIPIGRMWCCSKATSVTMRNQMENSDFSRILLGRVERSV